MRKWECWLTQTSVYNKYADFVHLDFAELSIGRSNGLHEHLYNSAKLYLVIEVFLFSCACCGKMSSDWCYVLRDRVRTSTNLVMNPTVGPQLISNHCFLLSQTIPPFLLLLAPEGNNFPLHCCQALVDNAFSWFLPNTDIDRFSIWLSHAVLVTQWY